mgnify:CR=1 FL=1
MASCPSSFFIWFFPFCFLFILILHLNKHDLAPRGQKERPVKNYRPTEIKSISTKTETKRLMEAFFVVCAALSIMAAVLPSFVFVWKRIPESRENCKVGYCTRKMKDIFLFCRNLRAERRNFSCKTPLPNEIKCSTISVTPIDNVYKWGILI